MAWIIGDLSKVFTNELSVCMAPIDDGRSLMTRKKFKVVRSKGIVGQQSEYVKGAPFRTFLDATLHFESEAKKGICIIEIQVPNSVVTKGNPELVVFYDSVEGNNYRIIDKVKYDNFINYRCVKNK